MLKLIKDDIFIWKGLNKNQIEKTLFLINKSKHHSFDNISFTDWDLEISKDYWDFLWNECLLDFKKSFYKNFNCDDLIVRNYWFQKYEKEDFHQKHVHEGCHFTNVLFLENSQTNPTNIISYSIPKKYIVDGNILSFPSYRVHESKKHNFKKSKTIVSFNTDLCKNSNSNPRKIKYKI